MCPKEDDIFRVHLIQRNFAATGTAKLKIFEHL
ncbi:hypothetical protein ES707_07212 [subsurface metagenome]